MALVGDVLGLPVVGAESQTVRAEVSVRLSNSRILPGITLGTVYAAYVARLTRGGMLEVVRSDFVRTARASGLSP